MSTFAESRASHYELDDEEHLTIQLLSNEEKALSFESHKPPFFLRKISFSSYGQISRLGIRLDAVRRKCNNYRFAIRCCLATLIAVFVTNVGLTIWAMSGFGARSQNANIYEGSCSTSKNIAFWLHLLINALSTLLVAASNFCMQCLSSPTREEIDRAHCRGTWLHIGVPSYTNLRKISFARCILWFMFAISSIPLHLLYNSAIFFSLGTRPYSALHMFEELPENFELNSTTNFNGDLTAMSELWDTFENFKNNPQGWRRLNNSDCIETYTALTLSAYSDLILVAPGSNSTTPVIDWGFFESEASCQLDSAAGLCDMNSWPCNRNACTMSSSDGSHGLSYWNISQIASNWTLNHIPVEYCQAKVMPEKCTVQFSLTIMLVVIICNFVKVVSMSILIWRHSTQPLLTLGDAVSSFLQHPDFATEGSSAVGRSWFQDSHDWTRFPSNCKGRRNWIGRQVFWFNAASISRWICSNAL